VWAADSGAAVYWWRGPGRAGFQGTADAVCQSLGLIDHLDPDVVMVFASDHIYQMDIAQMVTAHLASGAGVTVSACLAPRARASAFGVMETGPDGAIRGWEEKPAHPVPSPFDPSRSLVSMGNYVFDPGVLRRALIEDGVSNVSSHDFGRDVIPALVEQGMASAYDFSSNRTPGARTEPYWRDIGAVDEYYRANLEVADPAGPEIFGSHWPLRTRRPGMGDPIFLSHPFAKGDSVISWDARVHPSARIEDSVILPFATVGPGAVVRRAIIGENAHCPAGAVVVGSPSSVAEPGWWVSPAGVAVFTERDSTRPGVSVPHRAPERSQLDTRRRQWATPVLTTS